MNVRKWDSAVLDEVLHSRGADPLRMLLVRDMCLIANEDGRAPLLTLATRFRNFFRKRGQEGKAELDPGAIATLRIAGSPGEQTVDWWSATIVERLLDERLSQHGDDLLWRSELWSGWSAGFRKALRNAAEIRLIEYFENNVVGGW